MPRLASATLLLLLPIALTGCTLTTQTTSHTTSQTTTQAALHGSVRGGQQPVAGAVIRLMAPGLTGYGSAPTLIATTLTDGGGGFTLPAYTCPAGNGLVYLQATGGDSGSGPNLAINEVALLGPCSSLSASTFIIVSEATTVAAAYALAPFASVTATSTGIGTSSTNTLGLANAFGPFSNLVDFHTGATRPATSQPGMLLPTATVNTLADILAACVNTASTLNSTQCNTLFTATTVNGVAPSDTFQAALNIALHPGTRVATLFGLASASAPFQPTLTAAPSDFALAIAYNGGSIANSAGTTGVAIDAAGNAWVGTGTFSSTHVLTELDPFGNYLSGAVGFGSGNLTSPNGVAIDTTGNVYVCNPAANNVVKFSSSGAYLATITASSFSNPNGLALGADGNLYVSNFNGNKLTRILTSTLTEDPNGIFTTGQEGVGVATNQSAVWVADYQTNLISRIASGTSTVVNYGVGSTPSALALDAQGAAWTTLLHTVAKVSDTGTLLSGTGFAPNSVHIPQDIVLDGLNRAWVSNYQGGYTLPGSLIELANDGTVLSSNDGFVANGVIPGGPAVPNGIAIDGSGNVWITGYKIANSALQNSTTGNVVAEIIGIAAPVVTPRALASVNNTVATRP